MLDAPALDRSIPDVSDDNNGGLFKHKHKIDPREVHALPGLRPAKDEVFLHLLERALRGEESVFYAAVPMEMVVPFDPEYDPEAHPVGRQAVMALIQEWEQGHFTPVWVYPRAGKYVLSDDYIILAAARRGEPDYLPCYVVGRPLYDGLEDIQTLSPDAVSRALGFA